MATLCATALSLVFRWRKAPPVVRAQLKWLALAGVPLPEARGGGRGEPGRIVENAVQARRERHSDRAQRLWSGLRGRRGRQQQDGGQGEEERPGHGRSIGRLASRVFKGP